MIQSSELIRTPQATLERVGGPPHGVRRSAPPRRPDAARTRRRALVAGDGLALAAFAAGALLGGLHVPTSQRTVERFASAWARGDFAAMYSELSPPERDRVRRGAFTRAYQRALETATAERVVTGHPSRDEDAYEVPVRVDTRLWGSISGNVRVPITDAGVNWSRDL